MFLFIYMVTNRGFENIADLFCCIYGEFTKVSYRKLTTCIILILK